MGKETLGNIVGSCWALKVCTACCAAEWALGGTNAAGAACSFPRKNLDGWGAWKACEYCAAERALCVADAVRRAYLDGW